ncbi:MAG: sigma-54-dependent transcriptional regulator [Candidatus Acidiferrales bacterium]
MPICLVATDPEQVEAELLQLDRLGFSSTEASTPERALQRIQTGACRLLIVDSAIAGMDGLEFLDQALRADPGVYVILVSSDNDVGSAIEAIKRGAYDVVHKPVDFMRLENTLGELAGLFSQRSHVRHLEETLLENSQFHGIVGRSPAMLQVLELTRKVARHYSNALITGPTGAGKELVARALHELSPVAHERFAVCNCSALVDTLLESQLFGHMRGSFTGATDTRPGLFEYANQGAVFLDEIGEMSVQTQAKLLRVIQNREIQRIGSPEVKKVNVRLVAATNRNLREEVRTGRFREDLYYRLSSVQIRVPGLSERPEDIPVLVQHFLKKFSAEYGKELRGFTRRAQIALLHHSWPGNVRELENVIGGAAMACTAEFIDLGDLGDFFRPLQDLSNLRRGQDWSPLPLRQVRETHIQRVIEFCNGNHIHAAGVLGIGKTTLYRFLKGKNDPRYEKPNNSMRAEI